MLSPTTNSIIRSDYAALVSLLTRKLQDRSLAEDLINQAFVRALDKLAAGRIANPDMLSGYVYQVAFNLLRNQRRRMENRSDLRASSDAAEFVSDGKSPFEQVFSASVCRQVRELIAGLRVQRDRDVLQRFYLEEVEKDCICDELAITSRQFDRILFRARRRIRAMLQSRGLGRQDLLMEPHEHAHLPVELVQVAS